MMMFLSSSGVSKTARAAAMVVGRSADGVGTPLQVLCGFEVDCDVGRIRQPSMMACDQLDVRDRSFTCQ